jgi:NADH:ubiquinone oxidoreductase subunit K
MTITLHHFMILSAIVFGCGLATVLTRRHAIGILIGVELMLNAASINMVAFNRYSWSGEAAATGGDPVIDGMMFALFIIVIAAAEAAVALGIVLSFYNRLSTVDVEKAVTLKG